MNGGGDTPSTNTRFSLRPVVGGNGAYVLCDNFGRILQFQVGDEWGCIAVVNGIATLISNIYDDANYAATANSYGPFNVEPIIDGSIYEITIPAIYQLPAGTLIVTLGQQVSNISNYVAVSADCYWRPAGNSKILCDNQGRILIICYGDQNPTRQEVIDDDADCSVIFLNYNLEPRMAETWADTQFYSQRRALLESYDFIIINLSSTYSSNYYNVPLPNGAILYYLNNGAQGLWQVPDSFEDYPL